MQRFFFNRNYISHKDELNMTTPGGNIPEIGKSKQKNMAKMSFKCIECNEEASELYRDYRNGIVKITICVSAAC